MIVTRLGRSRRCGIALAALATATVAVSAQEQKLPPPPCSGPEHRHFDFWIGEWDVTQPDGGVAGANRIEKILDGCVLYESWRSANGKSQGHSFNIHGRDGKWHQTWVDNSGTLLELTGGIVEGRMVMSQDTTRPDGTPVRHEISWEPLDTGQVRQHWRTSNDSGRTWNDVFVGIYTRKP